jgi:hypothetical protein
VDVSCQLDAPAPVPLCVGNRTPVIPLTGCPVAPLHGELRFVKMSQLNLRSNAHTLPRQLVSLSQHGDEATGWAIRVRLPVGVIVLLATASRLALGPTQSPFQCVPGTLSPELQADHSPPYSAEVKNEWSYPPLPYMSS